MIVKTTRISLAIVTLAAGLAHAQAPGGHILSGVSPFASPNKSVERTVQRTRSYTLRRPEVVSGSRLTLFANFLQGKPGYVVLDLNGTTHACTLVNWRNNSVTAELPRLGLSWPKNAQIRIIKPNGRVAKTFQVLFVSQPDIVIHKDTIPQPVPPIPAVSGAMFGCQ